MGTAAAERGWAAVRSRFPTVRGSGPVVVIREIADRDEWSQHSYGNAFDAYPPAGEVSTRQTSSRTLESLYQWLLTQKQTLSIATLCYRGRGGCTTDHWDHVHVDFHPKISGSPYSRSDQRNETVPPEIAQLVTQSAAQLRQLDCAKYAQLSQLVANNAPAFSPEQRSALIARANECGANNPLLPDQIEGAFEAVGDVGAILGRLTSGETWVRISWIVGGFLAILVGVLFIAREYGFQIGKLANVVPTGRALNVAKKALT